MQGHRLVVAPRSGLRRAPNKRCRIYESEYLGWTLYLRMVSLQGGSQPSNRKVSRIRSALHKGFSLLSLRIMSI